MSVYTELVFQPMLITDVFESLTASKAWYDKSALDMKGISLYPFISRTKADNGIAGFCPLQEKDPEAGGAITIGLDTQTIGFQTVPFYTSQNIQILRHSRMTLTSAVVLIRIIATQLRKFSWGGNGATLGRLKATKIMVPVITDETGKVAADWEGMTRLGEELFVQVRARTEHVQSADDPFNGQPPELTFEPMLITDVFESLAASKAWYDKVHLSGGRSQCLYLSQTWANNGVSDLVAFQEVKPESGNCITVTLKTQSTFYQPVSFYSAQNFLIFRHARLTSNSGLFLVTLMRRAFKKFSWGYGVSIKRLEATKIMVPVVEDMNGIRRVDWEGMELYGRWLNARVNDRLNAAVMTPAHTPVDNAHLPSTICG